MLVSNTTPLLKHDNDDDDNNNNIDSNSNSNGATSIWSVLKPGGAESVKSDVEEKSGELP